MNKFFFILFTYFIQFTLQDNIPGNTTFFANNNNTKPLYLRRKTKFCNFKCNCFFPHSSVNDNIYVTNWMKPFGL